MLHCVWRETDYHSDMLCVFVSKQQLTLSRSLCKHSDLWRPIQTQFLYYFTLNLEDNLCSPICILWFDSLLMRKGCNPSFLSSLNRGKVERAGDKLLRSKGDLACLQEYTLLHTHQLQGGHGNWFRDELFLQWKPTSPLSARRHFVAIIYRAFRKRRGSEGGRTVVIDC